MISAVELTTNNFITFLFRKHFQTSDSKFRWL